MTKFRAKWEQLNASSQSNEALKFSRGHNQPPPVQDRVNQLQIIMPWGKLGQVPKCPACDKSVYPVEQVFAADRKPFHRSCIQCQVRGCRFGYGDIIGSLSIR